MNQVDAAAQQVVPPVEGLGAQDGVLVIGEHGHARRDDPVDVLDVPRVVASASGMGLNPSVRRNGTVVTRLNARTATNMRRAECSTETFTSSRLAVGNSLRATTNPDTVGGR